jgi:hypothetical protein
MVDCPRRRVLHLPSGVPHRANALEDTLDVDIFSPPRQDWIDKTDAYRASTLTAKRTPI